MLVLVALDDAGRSAADVVGANRVCDRPLAHQFGCPFFLA
jgi:hypothetical protein